MNRPIRITLMTVASAGLLASLPATSWAGEVTGSGQGTPIRSHIAASECSFSGLEDWASPTKQDPPDAILVDPGTVQNWGAIPHEVRQEMPAIFHPGNSCNPNGIPLPPPPE